MFAPLPLFGRRFSSENLLIGQCSEPLFYSFLILATSSGDQTTVKNDWHDDDADDDDDDDGSGGEK